eukprot:1157222-Pelagomonas_calceolata.AAC.15
MVCLPADHDVMECVRHGMAVWVRHGVMDALVMPSSCAQSGSSLTEIRARKTTQCEKMGLHCQAVN